MSWRKNKQELIEKARIRFDEEAFLMPSQVIKEFCNEHGIKQEELDSLFQWFTDPIGDHFYFVSKDCSLDITNLKTKPHKTILSFLVDYVNNFNQMYEDISKGISGAVENIPYLKIMTSSFLNKKIYFVSRSSVSQRAYIQHEPFDRKDKNERFMQSFYEFALTKKDHY